MLKLPKPAAITIQATLGAALNALWAVPALADAAPANAATQSQTTPLLHEGALVRLRSGGPALTVKSVQGNWGGGCSRTIGLFAVEVKHRRVASELRRPGSLS